MTASLPIKLTRLLDVDLEALASNEELSLVVELRVALTDPLLASDAMTGETFTAVAVYSAAARAVLTSSRA